MESMPKFRILCLHGYQQNAAVFREKSGSFRRPMKKYADFVFMNAPHEVEWEHISQTASDTISASVAPIDCRGWWYVSERFHTRNVKDHEGFEESVQAVVNFAQKEGPFDGILGFSQGATLAFLLSSLKQKGDVNIDFRFLILISGFPSRNLDHQGLNEMARPNLPCLHVFGETDKVVSHELSAELVKLFDKDMVVAVKHPGGHMMPNMSKYKTVIDKFFGIVKSVDSI
ncbi:GH07367p, putative [Brugia malayi]|uniref:Bm2374 n=1 Tax=Brugia malayi TaxID=6279 RepID=A0A0K0J5N5_BRUMA|nr:GH07367p, putative [Brugia malayi]CTP81511.1 Bm2374 [Brugia malayi]VIO94622.1 GH07367p, putative [Brugia malayi]